MVPISARAGGLAGRPAPATKRQPGLDQFGRARLGGDYNRWATDVASGGKEVNELERDQDKRPYFR